MVQNKNRPPHHVRNFPRKFQRGWNVFRKSELRSTFLYMDNNLKKKQFAFIFVTTFLNFLGFSIIIPVIPFIVQRYEPNPNTIALYVGLILSSYAFCQFLAAPALGVLSDRFGRRPILLISLFGSVIGYLLLGFGGSLAILFLGRIIDGLTGGNISTVFAYVADITEPQERGKYFGILGAIGGLGFMLGPAIGGATGAIHLSAPLFIAAAVTALNMLWGFFFLPESLKKEHKLDKTELSHLNPFGQFSHLLSIDSLKILFPMAFLYFLAATMLQGNLSVFTKDILNWGPKDIGFLLFIVGIVDIFSQGFLTAKLMPVLGDKKLMIFGALLNGIGIMLVGLIFSFHSIYYVLAVVILLNIGDGVFQPSLSSLISKSVEPKKQGRVQGASQSIQAMSRVLGPLFAAWLYQYGKSLPYFGSGLIVLIALVIFLANLDKLRSVV